MTSERAKEEEGRRRGGVRESTQTNERRHEGHHKGEGGGGEGDARTSEDTCGSSGQAWSSWFEIHELGTQAKGGTDD